MPQKPVSFREEEVDMFEWYFEEYKDELVWDLITSKTELIRWCTVEKLKELNR